MLLKSLVIFCLIVFHSICLFGQKIGLRSDLEFSDNDKLNRVFGGGIYLNVDSLTKKVDFIVSFDLTSRKREFQSEEMRTNHNKYMLGLSSTYSLILNKKTNFKTGIGFYYNVINARHQGIYSNWINSYNSHSIGIGLCFNIELTSIFKLPLNLDFFVTPSYLLNIYNESDPSSIISEYAKNFKILNTQIGLTYTLK